MSERMGRKGMEQAALDGVYVQETRLPVELEGRIRLVSCLFFQEERQVYLAEDDAGQKSILKRSVGSQKQLLAREADFLKTLPYTFLPELLFWKEEEEEAWLQREYVPGDTLWELVERKGPLELTDASALMCRICEMAAQFHEADPPLIYRDFKPQNIILTPERNLFVIDLGTMRRHRDDASCDTMLLGTRQTAAPEQFGFQQTDERSDVYALGVLYFYLLTGSLDLRDAKLLESLPEDCRRVVKKCTAFSPDGRYKDCRVLKDEIAKNSVGGFVPQKRRRRRRAAMAAAALGVIFLLSAGVFSFTNTKKNAPYEFRSEMIAQAVRAQLGRSADRPVYREELEQIETLRICGEHILELSDVHEHYCGSHEINGEDRSAEHGTVSDLSDCALMKNLHTLVLDRQQITDLTPLEGLPLVSVSLCDNPITDLSPLAASGMLEELFVEETQVQDLTPLSGLTSLTSLDIGSTLVTDINSLEGLEIEELLMAAAPVEYSEVLPELPLKRLVLHSVSRQQEEQIGSIKTLCELTIYGYRHEDLTPLASLSGLTYLDIFNGGVNTLDGIGAFPYLELLNVGMTAVSDLSPLLKTKELTGLEIANSHVTDFTVLKEMNQLQWVGCSYSQGEELERQFPDHTFELRLSEDNVVTE